MVSCTPSTPPPPRYIVEIQIAKLLCDACVCVCVAQVWLRADPACSATSQTLMAHVRHAHLGTSLEADKKHASDAQQVPSPSPVASALVLHAPLGRTAAAPLLPAATVLLVSTHWPLKTPAPTALRASMSRRQGSPHVPTVLRADMARTLGAAKQPIASTVLREATAQQGVMRTQTASTVPLARTQRRPAVVSASTALQASMAR